MAFHTGRTALSLILLAGLAACASPGRPHGPGGERAEGGPPPAPRLFISPAGQPFRAAPAQPQPLDQWWTQADADRDGVLSRAELTADALAFFETLDVEPDGAIDGVEVTRYEKEVVPEILQGFRPQGAGEGPRAGGPRRGGPGEGPPGGGMGPGGGGKGRPGADGREGRRAGGGAAPIGREGAGRWSLLNEPQPIMSADADWSRRVTREEFQRKAEMVFKQLDRDHDGRLTREELPPLPGQGR